MREFFMALLALVSSSLFGQQLVMEVGAIVITHQATHITPNNSFVDPVVIALPSGYNGSHEATVRVDNVTGTGFDIYLEEPVNRDGAHTTETVHYAIVEKGNYVFPDGTVLEAGTVSSSNLSFQTVGLLGTNFLGSPAIFTQVQTDNSSTRFLHTRQRNALATSFEVKLEREESLNTTSPSSLEVIGYFAIEKRTGSLDGVAFEAGAFAATHTVSSRAFTQSFSSGLHNIAAISTYNGSDPATLRWTSLSVSAVQAFVDEDISLDSETNHASETIDFFAIDDNAGQGIFLNTSLNIELLDFSATLIGQDEVALKWITTAKIEPNDYFEVQRSLNGIDWSIEELIGSPISRSTNRIYFGAVLPYSNGTNPFFRLKLIEQDGSYSYSPIREVSLADALVRLKVYPNPAIDFITINGIERAEEIQIFNLAGKEVSELCKIDQTSNYQIQVGLSSLSSGIYLIKTQGNITKLVKR